MVEVKSMSAKNMLLDLRDITTFYHDEIKNYDRARRVINAEESKKNKIANITVEKLSSGGYIVIEDFDFYSAWVTLKSSTPLLCLVNPCTSEKQRLLHILKSAISPSSRSSWRFKSEHVKQLIEVHSMTVKDIARHLEVETERIDQYILDNRIPDKIRDLVLPMNAKTVVEKIRKAREIPEELKFILYKRAVLNKGEKNKLTGNKYEKMKTLCSLNVYPPKLLSDTAELERIVDELISSDFEIERHMQSLLDSYIAGYEKKDDKEDIYTHVMRAELSDEKTSYTHYKN
jgi:hypothetical protein